tara:strand:- start:632 stop:1030 length:399 start_codon:yes stop_codon:yes gene_type:complete
MTKVKNTSFANKILSSLNKTEGERQSEAVLDKVEDFKTEFDTHIALLTTSAIPSKETEIKRAKRNLTKVKKAYDATLLNVIGKSFDSYITDINVSKRDVSNADSVISSLKSELDDLKADKEDLAVLAAMFNA